MSTLLATTIGTTDAAATAAALVGSLVTTLLVWVVVGLGFMGVFTKAGQPGWAGFVPIYNTFVLLKVVGRPLWWFLLTLIPVVGLVVAIIIYHDLSKSFGKGVGFTIGLLLLPPVFIWILWLGSATYRGPAGQGVVDARPAYAA